MVEMTPAWKNPCCWDRSGRKGSAISTRPGSTRSMVAPRSRMMPCFAKLARVRRSKSGSAGVRVEPRSSAAERGDFRQRKTVEVAGVGGGVGAGVLDEDEVALLQVGGKQLLAHHHVHRVARGARHVPRHRLAIAVRIDVVAQALGGLDHATEHPG